MGQPIDPIFRGRYYHQSVHKNLEERKSLLFSDALYNQDGPNMEMLYDHCLSTLPCNIPFERFKIIRQD
jgi:hypothetical protein